MGVGVCFRGIFRGRDGLPNKLDSYLGQFLCWVSQRPPPDPSLSWTQRLCRIGRRMTWKQNQTTSASMQVENLTALFTGGILHGIPTTEGQRQEECGRPEFWTATSQHYLFTTPVVPTYRHKTAFSTERLWSTQKWCVRVCACMYLCKCSA